MPQDSSVDSKQAAKAIRTILFADPKTLSASGLLYILVRYVSHLPLNGLFTPDLTPPPSRSSSPDSRQSLNEFVSNGSLNDSVTEVAARCASSSSSSSSSSSGSSDRYPHKDGLDFRRFPRGSCGEVLLRMPPACDELDELWSVHESDEANFHRLAGREDCRIDHLRLGESRQRPSPESKLFAYLAARHLSTGYLSQREQGEGDVRAYAKSLVNVRDITRAERGIRDGLKYALLEEKMGCAGPSAIASQVWQFRNLPDGDFDTAVRYLSALEFGKVNECARRWNPRVEELQKLYSGAVESCQWTPGGIGPHLQCGGQRVSSRIPLPPLVPRPESTQPTNPRSGFTVANQGTLIQRRRPRSEVCRSGQAGQETTARKRARMSEQARARSPPDGDDHDDEGEETGAPAELVSRVSTARSDSITNTSAHTDGAEHTNRPLDPVFDSGLIAGVETTEHNNMGATHSEDQLWQRLFTFGSERPNMDELNEMFGKYFEDPRVPPELSYPPEWSPELSFASL